MEEEDDADALDFDDGHDRRTSSSSQPSTSSNSRSSTPSTVVPTPRLRRSKRLNPDYEEEEEGTVVDKKNCCEESTRSERRATKEKDEESSGRDSGAESRNGRRKTTWREESPVLERIEVPTDLFLRSAWGLQPPLGDPAGFVDTDMTKVGGFLAGELVSWRLLLLLLQVLFNHWDFSTDAFKGVPSNESDHVLDIYAKRALGGLRRWDSIHFLHIAEHGYVFEQSLAFYPLFPLLIRFMGRMWAAPLFYLDLLNPSTAFYLTALAVNFMAFVVAGGALYRVVRLVTGSVKKAFIAILIFSINPASVFFSAPYTESLYSMFTFCGLTLLVDPRLQSTVRTMGAGACFAAAILTRSNGVLNMLYLIAFSGVHYLFEVDAEGRRRFTFTRSPITAIKRTLICAVELGIVLPLTLAPLAFYTRIQVENFCGGDPGDVPRRLVEYGRSRGWALRGDSEVLEFSSTFWAIPPWYATIQRKYWDVKLFGYWQLKKLPCFAMAAPAIFLVFYGCLQTCLRAVKRYRNVVDFLSEGLAPFAFALHSLAITGGALFVYNVEVATRLLFSSSPFLYLVLAEHIAEATPKVRLSDMFYPRRLPFLSYYCWRGWKEAVLLVYLLAYTITGTMMFVTWLPFT